MPTPINAVYDLGGTGHTTLYSHATGFHSMCWQPIANRLRNNHNIAYDARGHGTAASRGARRDQVQRGGAGIAEPSRDRRALAGAIAAASCRPAR